jgi:ATP-dependent Lhr-like helicase
VRKTAAYEHLSDENWTWVLDFIRRGGPSLTAYPGFRRVVPDGKGVWRVSDRQVALQHKLNIGAIVGDASVMVRYGPAPRGAKLGSVEESFVARMKAGDRFWFAGRFRPRSPAPCWTLSCGGTRRVHGAGACGRAPAHRGAAQMVGIADAVDAARGDAEIARRLAPVPLSFCRPRHSSRPHKLDRMACGAPTIF